MFRGCGSIRGKSYMCLSYSYPSCSYAGHCWRNGNGVGGPLVWTRMVICMLLPFRVAPLLYAMTTITCLLWKYLDWHILGSHLLLLVVASLDSLSHPIINQCSLLLFLLSHFQLMSSHLRVAVLTIAPWIYDLVLSSFELHPIFVSPVTLLLQFLALQASPRKMRTVSFMLWANISSTLALYSKITCKNIKQDGAKAAPWVILLVASLWTDASPFVKTHCCLLFTYFLPTLKFCYLGHDFAQPVGWVFKGR